MGVLQDQIAAIRANNALSEEEKRTAIYAVKCNGLKDYIGFVEQKTCVQVALLSLGRRRNEILDLRKSKWSRRDK